MVALIQEYSTYKKMYDLTVILPLKLFFSGPIKLEVPWLCLKGGVSPTPCLEIKGVNTYPQ